MQTFLRPSKSLALSAQNKRALSRYKPELVRELTGKWIAQGYGSSHLVFEDGTIEMAVFDNADIKSATDNVGSFGQREVTEAEAAKFGLTAEQANTEQSIGDIRFSRSKTPRTVPEVQALVRNVLNDHFNSAGEQVGWWDKTVGTQYVLTQHFLLNSSC